MLKLERTSHDHDVSITFRNKEHVFTRSFLTAFTVALMIHLGLILIFHISPLKIRWSNTPSLPIVIETDLAHNENLVLANISPETLPDHFLLTAPASLPYLPSTPIYSNPRQIEYSEKSHAILDLFNEIEKEIYLPAFSPASRASYSEPISILISGPLASKTLIKNPSAQEHQINISSGLNIQRPQHLLYSVLVDEQSGRVFWHESLQKIDNPSLETFATTMIYEMQFAPTPSAFVVAGQIELHLK